MASAAALPPKMATEVFTALQAEGQLEAVASEANTTGGFIRIPGFLPTFTMAQQQRVEQLLRYFKDNPYTPPVRAQTETGVGSGVLASLIEQGRLVKLRHNLLFLLHAYEEA